MKWLLFFLPFFAFTKDFGRMGQVFEIEEESFSDYMQKNLSSKAMDEKFQQAKDKLLEQAKNPLPVAGIKCAKKSKSFSLDLTHTVQADIKDLKGRVIARAGATINPLERIQLSCGLLFLDGDHEEHLEWARKQQGEFKWILVKGKPFDLEMAEKRPIYFDQGGKYTSRFRIENIPARVVQKGKVLWVEEVGLGDL